MNKKKLNKKKGFTLIELIVVIAILGILAAIAIPRLSGFQGNANKKAILSNLKVMDTAITTYAADKNVEITAVTTTNITTDSNLLTEIPDSPTTHVTYSINASGKAQVVLDAAIPGLVAGTYTAASTELQ